MLQLSDVCALAVAAVWNADRFFLSVGPQAERISCRALMVEVGMSGVDVS
jgi:hypothetical protein